MTCYVSTAVLNITLQSFTNRRPTDMECQGLSEKVREFRRREGSRESLLVVL